MLSPLLSVRSPFFLCLLAALLSSPCAAAAVTPAILGDHMVLQRDSEVPVWGWAGAGEQVTVTASWEGAEPVVVKAGENGRFRAMLPTPGAGGPHTLTVAGERGPARTFQDVLVGEVWVCSGQSNMEWSVARSDNPQEEIAAARIIRSGCCCRPGKPNRSRPRTS